MPNAPQTGAPETPEPPTAGTPPSTPPPGGQGEPAALETTGFKWGASAPEYLRGKDAAQTLDLMDKLVTTVQRMAAEPQTPPAQPHVETMSQPVEQLDDDLLVTNPGEWRRRFAAQQQQQYENTLAAVATPVLQTQAALVSDVARRDPAAADVAERWWDEVEQMVAPIPAHMRTPALYAQAVKVARSNHVDEIAKERAERMMAAGTGLEGSGTRVNPDGTVATDADDALWTRIKGTAVGAAQIERYGRAKVVAAAKAMGGLEAYAAMLEKSKTTFDPARPGRMDTELL